MKALVLLLPLLVGCTATNMQLRPSAEAAQTLADVDRLGHLQPAHLYFWDGSPTQAVHLRHVTATYVETGRVNPKRWPLAAVSRIEVDVHRGRPGIWAVVGTAAGSFVGLVVSTSTCPQDLSGIGCGIEMAGKGGLLGVLGGYMFGMWEARRDPPVIIYQGPPERYTKARSD